MKLPPAWFTFTYLHLHNIGQIFSYGGGATEAKSGLGADGAGATQVGGGANVGMVEINGIVPTWIIYVWTSFSSAPRSPLLEHWRQGQSQLQRDRRGTPAHAGRQVSIPQWFNHFTKFVIIRRITCTFMMLQAPPRLLGANAVELVLASWIIRG